MTVHCIGKWYRFWKLMRLHEWSRCIHIQFRHDAQKENQMPSSSNHFSQCPTVDRILQSFKNFRVCSHWIIGNAKLFLDLSVDVVVKKNLGRLPIPNLPVRNIALACVQCEQPLRDTYESLISVSHLSLWTSP